MSISRKSHSQFARRRPLELARQLDPSICALCRSLLERPSISRCEDAANHPIIFTLDSLSKRCRLCERFGLYARRHGSAEAKLCFDLEEIYPAYQRTPPTNLTRCYIGLERSPEEGYGINRWYGEWQTGIDVDPIAQRLLRDVIPERVVLPIVSSSTGDREALGMIRRWMNECLKNHKTCHTLVDHSVVGKSHVVLRLISVEKRDRLKLIESEQADRAKPSRPLRYATLTHKWGFKGLPVLTRANKDALSRRIDLLSLPRTFRDAIRVCQVLAIPYLWIDTLCIVQDDKIEQALEISNMGQVYAHACLNIGALAAAEIDIDMDDGLFSDRSRYAEERNPICARVQRCDFDELCYVGSPDSPDGLGYYTLMSRGWVLQERLLSSCSVYFDVDEIRWECSELLASEYHPRGVPYQYNAQHSPRTWGDQAPFRMGSLLLHCRNIAAGLRVITHKHEEDNWSSKYQCWMRVVEVFSQCHLTHASDCLLAVSGLAKYFAREFDDSYLAGLWKKDLFCEVLWHSNGFRDEIETEDTPQSREAPSWSWAFKPFGVEFIFNSWDDAFGCFVSTAKILEATTILKGKDPTGNVSGGYIVMSGPMHRTKPGLKTRSVAVRPQFDWYDRRCDSYTKSNTAINSYHFLMGYTPYSSKEFHLKVGLILEPLDGTPGTYRRIGMFAHPLSSIVPRYQAVPMPGECEEFLSFDPTNYECHTVKIV